MRKLGTEQMESLFQAVWLVSGTWIQTQMILSLPGPTLLIMRFYSLWWARSLLFVLLEIFEQIIRIITEQLLHTGCWGIFPGQGEGMLGDVRDDKAHTGVGRNIFFLFPFCMSME